MLEAGYSKTPLYRKLGLKTGHRACFISPPSGYWEHIQPEAMGIVIATEADEQLDFIHYFATVQAELFQQFPVLKQRLAYNGMLWISWPKKASRLTNDLTESIVRQTGLNGGLVDVKICAVDEDWSGLKFVYRVSDRPKSKG